jgi:hypothetical protein
MARRVRALADVVYRTRLLSPDASARKYDPPG